MRRFLLVALLLLGALPLVPAQVRADGPFPGGMSAPPIRAYQDAPAPLDPATDREATVRSLVAAWNAAAGLAGPAEQAPASQSSPLTALAGRSSGLVGANFPIANFPDVVSDQESLTNPEVAHNHGRDEYLVVWQAYVRATGNNIYARRMTSGGAFSGPVFAVCAASGDQAAPTVAYDSSLDQYWVVWTDYRGGENAQIIARRVSSTGALLGTEISVSPYAEHQFAASVACGGGRTVIAWVRRLVEISTMRIVVRGFNNDGSPYKEPLRLSPEVGVATEPDVCYDSEDQHFLAVWAEARPATGWDIYSWRITADMFSANPLDEADPISTASGDQRVPRPAYNPNSDRYLIVWHDGRNLATRGSDIYGQLMTRNGARSGRRYQSIPARTRTRTRPLVRAPTAGSSWWRSNATWLAPAMSRSTPAP